MARRYPRTLFAAADALLAALVAPAAWLLGLVRRVGVHRLPLCRRVLLGLGVFPLRAHYYEPAFDHRSPRRPWSAERPLPGIDLDVDGQLALLASFTAADELAGIGSRATAEGEFHFDNQAFESGDAEFWYQLIRASKPGRIVEVGSGYSTLMARRALARNRADDPGYACRHVCIEPYEMPWLERCGVEVVRERVETLPLSFFGELDRDDILFIDSSHVIRPEGDVLFEYLELLPTLRDGVVVHVHDIFTPRNYPDEWLRERVRFWNEQYLLEAFLSHNRCWRVVAALNFLQHHHHDALRAVAPYLTPEAEPGSFYLRRVGDGDAA